MKAAVADKEQETYPMPLTQAEATEDKLAVGTTFSGKQQWPKQALFSLAE